MDQLFWAIARLPMILDSFTGIPKTSSISIGMRVSCGWQSRSGKPTPAYTETAKWHQLVPFLAPQIS